MVDYQSIYKQLSWRLKFVDSTLQGELEAFEHPRNHRTAVLVILLYILVFLPASVLTFIYNETISEFVYSLAILFHILVILATCAFIAIQSILDAGWQKWSSTVQAIFLSVIPFGLVFSSFRPYFTDCSHYPTSFWPYLMHWHCMNNDDSAYYILTSLLNFFILITVRLVNENRIDLIIAITLFYNLIMILSGVLSEQKFAYYIYVIISLVSVSVVTVEMNLFRIHNFLNHKRLQESYKQLREHERAEDLRNMIGNVAHDLKTPLVSFMTGVDIFTTIVTHMEDQLVQELSSTGGMGGESAKRTNQVLACFQVHKEKLLDCIRSIRNTNSLMLMTINRCIDYTKASQGLVLTPSIESVCWPEMVDIPVQCMRTLQERVEIVWKGFDHRIQPSSISKQIFTDKMWLQENLLCLISNAVKYSIQSPVTVSVRVVTIPFHPLRMKATPNRTSPVNPKVHMDDPEDSGLEKTKSNTFRKAGSLTSAVGTQELEEEEQEDKVYLRFEVEDHGSGLSVEAMKTIFEPIQHTHRLTGGTGLGLFSLAKRVEALGGHYAVQNRTDGQSGCLFWFAIPYCPDADAQDSPPRSCSVDELSMLIVDTPKAQQHRQSPTSYNIQVLRPISLPEMRYHEDLTQNKAISVVTSNEMNVGTVANAKIESRKYSFVCSTLSSFTPIVERKKSILIVDDSPTIVKMITMMMKQKGYEIFTADNGDIAIQRMESRWKELQQPFDLILMDIQMPMMNGIEATEHIRAREAQQLTNSMFKKGDNLALRKQYIIGMSANSDEMTIREALQAGMNAFLRKPFTYNEYNDLVKSFNTE